MTETWQGGGEGEGDDRLGRRRRRLLKHSFEGREGGGGVEATSGRRQRMRKRKGVR